MNTTGLDVESRVLFLSSNPTPKVIQRPEATVYRAKLTIELASCGMSIEVLSMFRELLVWADVVHYHFPWPFADLMHFLVPHDKPRLVTYHSDIVRQRALGHL